jgi:hypothetical protein
VLDKSAIYHKSAAGAEAITNRNPALSPKLRSMLIMIDGRRGCRELARLGQGLGDPEQLMAQLEAAGFIEAGSAREGPPSLPAPLYSSSGPMPVLPAAGPPLSARRDRAAPALETDSVPMGLEVISRPAPLESQAPPRLAPTALAVPLPEAQRFAIARLTDLLGPTTAEDLCQRIQATRSAHEFRAAIRRTETLLREFVGPELAQQFVSEVEHQRPA